MPRINTQRQLEGKSISLPPEAWAKMDRLAERRGLPISTYARTVLMDHLIVMEEELADG